MNPAPKKYHHDYYLGPEGMTEHDDWRQAGEDIHNQRQDGEEHTSREPIHVNDEDLREKVISILRADANLDPNEIEVDVQHGEVTLRGTVTSRWMKQKVLADIAEIFGVKDVDNQLEVDRPAERESA
jgi:osmotically-inducible protein OsmY